MPDDELTASAGPAGVSVASKGSQTINVLLAVAVCVWVWYVNFTQDSRASERETARVVATKEVVDVVKQQTKAIEALTYVSSLPDAEKRKLNLAEPESVRELRRRPRVITEMQR